MRHFRIFKVGFPLGLAFKANRLPENRQCHISRL